MTDLRPRGSFLQLEVLVHTGGHDYGVDITIEDRIIKVGRRIYFRIKGFHVVEPVRLRVTGSLHSAVVGMGAEVADQVRPPVIASDYSDVYQLLMKKLLT